MPTEEEIQKQTVDSEGVSIPTELQIPVTDKTEEKPFLEQKADIEREAEDGAVKAWLGQLKAEDVPEDEKELITFIRKHIPRLTEAKDAEVLAAWRGEKEKKAAAAEATKVDQPAWRPAGYNVYDTEGKALEAYTPEIQAFLEKSTFGYNALGVEQKRSFAEVVRNASMGHLNHQRYTMLQSDVKRLQNELEAANGKVTEYGSQFDVYDRAILAASQGNVVLLEALVEQAKTEPTAADPEVAGLKQKIADYEQSERGREWLEQTRPYFHQLASHYGVAEADRQALEEFALEQIGNIPMLDQAKIDAYLKYDLPMSLQAGGYAEGGMTSEVTAPVTEANGAPGDASEIPEVVAINEMKATIQSLKAEVENMKNTAAAKNAGAGPPASGPGGTGAGSSDESPDFSTASEGLAWLRQR